MTDLFVINQIKRQMYLSWRLMVPTYGFKIRDHIQDETLCFPFWQTTRSIRKYYMQ